MILTEEERDFCAKHIDLIVKIVRSASASSISPDYREGLLTIAKKYKMINCSVCNSALYLATCRLYRAYEADLLEIKKNQEMSLNKTSVTPDASKSDDNRNIDLEQENASKDTKTKVEKKPRGRRPKK